MERESSYYHYYENTLTNAATGIKLVVGGTGLGKTSAIVDVVKEHPERKFLYIANRRRLLAEMEDNARRQLPKGSFVRIHRDVDQVWGVLRNHNLTPLLESDYAILADQKSPAWLGRAQVKQAIERIRRISHSEISRGDLYEVLESDARMVMRFLRYVVRAADGELDSNETILGLFPFMKFKLRDEVNLVLVTLQKLFYGMFDGDGDVDITALSGCTVFLDEFDFLEQNLLDLLCHAPEIDNLFEFVAPFYRVMTGRLAYSGYAQQHPRLKDRLDAITKIVERLQKEGFDFPAYTQSFLSPGTQFYEKGAQIFRTNHTVTATPVRIWQGDRGFEIAPAHLVDPTKGRSLTFVLGILHNAARRIVTLLKEYKQSQTSVYEELRTQCYGQTRSLYFDLVERIGYFPRTELPARTGFESLVGNGFNVYEVESLGQALDADAVELRMIAMHSTPERLLYDMVTRNLVFGLSATGDIDRHLHHFSLHWLREQEGVRWFDPSEDDRHLVQAINAKKHSERGNQLHAHLLPTLDNPILNRVIKHLAKEQGFADGKATVHHESRVESFFAVLEWANTHQVSASEPARHLVFLVSYRQIRLLFRSADFRQVPGLYEIQRISDEAEDFEVYSIQYGQTRYKVLFLNSERSERILDNDSARGQYDQLFWDQEPVLVITQYASAGAGVNLQYRPSPNATDEQMLDFTHVYLLDLPFYFFEDAGRTGAARKKNIWQLAKLYHSKQISQGQFQRLLGETHGGVLSQRYIEGHITGRDAQLNRLAILIQAVGRVERSWNPIPDQHVIMSQEVLHIFQQYVEDEEYAHIRSARESTNSANLSMLLSSIPALTSDVRRKARRATDSTLPIRNAASKEALEVLLDRLASLRGGSSDLDAREIWDDLRHATLRHDFLYRRQGEDTALLMQYHMVHATPLIEYGAVFLDEEGNLLDPKAGVGKRWWLDAVYDIIRDNPEIVHYFNEHGYEMGFIGAAGMVFTPYAYQAILTGAVGEAAVRALFEAELCGDVFEPLPDELYELVDLKLARHPICIDVKNYSEATLVKFGYDILEPDANPKLTTAAFARKAIDKLQQIQGYYGAGGRLVYVNLAGTGDRVGLELYNRDFSEVTSIDNAEIIVVESAIRRDSPRELSHGMQVFLDHLRRMYQ